MIARLLSLQAALLGLFASTYLLYAYVAHKPIACSASSGCEMVRLSQWAYVFGTVPRPLLGVLFYAIVVVLLLLRLASSWQPRALWRVMQLVVLCGVVESIALFFIQWREIGAFCIWCLTSAAASLELGIVAGLDRPLIEAPEIRTSELKNHLVLLLVLVPLMLIALFILLR